MIRGRLGTARLQNTGAIRFAEPPARTKRLLVGNATKNALRPRWIRVPGRGSLWLLPPGPDQVRNISSPEPIERAERSAYTTRYRSARRPPAACKFTPGVF